MPDIEKETRNNSVGESANRLLIDAYALSSRTTACVEARSRQALVLAGGAIVGGVKDIPVELANHPWEVAGKLAAASATGVVLGAAAAVESPIIAGAAVVAGTVTTGFALWNSYARLSKNEKLEHALNSVYKYGDSGTMRNSLKEACDAIGPEAFDYGIAMAGMPVGIHGPRTWSNLSANYFANKLVPYMPLGEVTAYRAIEMRLSDGSSLHMHGEEAIYRIGNAEHKLSVLSSNGVELGMRASYMGRQVLKGHTGSNAIEIEINPLTGITKVKDGQISKYKHSWLANQRLPFFSALCEECRPFRRSVQKSKRSEEFDL